MLKIIVGMGLLVLLMVLLFFAAAWYLRWARKNDMRVAIPPARRQRDRFTNPDADTPLRQIDGALSVWDHNAR